jgi:hypothetical protein
VAAAAASWLDTGYSDMSEEKSSSLASSIASLPSSKDMAPLKWMLYFVFVW